MPVGWYFVPYKRDVVSDVPRRYCAIDDQTYTLSGLIAWREIECLGDQAIVKVLASAGALTALNGLYQRIPKNALDDPLSDLTAGQKQALKDKILSLGYTLSELQAALGSDLGTKTLRDVLRFICSKRKKPRYDADTDSIIVDGAEVTQAPEVVDAVDHGVT